MSENFSYSRACMHAYSDLWFRMESDSEKKKAARIAAVELLFVI